MSVGEFEAQRRRRESYDDIAHGAYQRVWFVRRLQSNSPLDFHCQPAHRDDLNSTIGTASQMSHSYDAIPCALLQRPRNFPRNSVNSRLCMAVNVLPPRASSGFKAFLVTRRLLLVSPETCIYSLGSET